MSELLLPGDFVEWRYSDGSLVQRTIMWSRHVQKNIILNGKNIALLIHIDDISYTFLTVEGVFVLENGWGLSLSFVSSEMTTLSMV